MRRAWLALFPLLALTLGVVPAAAVETLRVELDSATNGAKDLPYQFGTEPLGTIVHGGVGLCFGLSPTSCDGSGTVELVDQLALPFWNPGGFVRSLATAETTFASYPIQLLPGEEVVLPLSVQFDRLGGFGDELTVATIPAGGLPGHLTVQLSANGIPSGPCLRDATTLCLQDDRFQVKSRFLTGDFTTGAGSGVELTPDTGYFWFFDPDNVESILKVLDACAPPFDHFWVFAAGLTDVEVQISVTDTETNEVSTYLSPLGNPFQPILDTQAFATCP